jgi:hypothetical protein
MLHAPGKSKRALDLRSLANGRISRNLRNLQNRNSAATEIAIRFGPKILLKCVRLKTGPKYPCTRIDDGYKSSFSLNHKFSHYDRRTSPHSLFILCNLSSQPMNSALFLQCLTEPLCRCVQCARILALSQGVGFRSTTKEPYY